jgi:hypothetical protein
MHDILVVLVHSIVTIVRLIKPGGLRAVVAESALTRVASVAEVSQQGQRSVVSVPAMAGQPASAGGDGNQDRSIKGNVKRNISALA